MTDHKTRVLFVDHDTRDHETNKNLLLNYSYKVTAVKLASTASAILSSSKERFDLVLANMMSPDDVSGFQLLQDAIQMDLLVILMLNDDDPLTNMRALEQGAFLCVQKSAAMHIMKYLWVHFVRRKAYPVEPLAIQNETYENAHVEGNENKTLCSVVEERQSSKRVNNLEVSKHHHAKFKRKVWTRWTKELHEKFVDAVMQLGEGRCYPNEILQLMNVPGLTRMQVASHLQICRNTIWVPPIEKIAKSATTTPLRNKAPRSKVLKIGAMPRLGTNFEPHHGIHKYDHGTNQEEMTFDPTIGDIFLDDYNNNNNDNGTFDHEVFQPELVLDHNGNNPFCQTNETIFGMGVPTQTYSMDELFMHGTQNVAPAVNIPPMASTDILEDPFEVSNLDAIVQELCAFEQEVGLESIYSHDEINMNNQIITATAVHNETNQLSQEMAKSVNDVEGWPY